MAKRERKIITNVPLLQEAIDASGKNPTVLAAEWNMSVPTYYSRTQGKSEFTASEICAAIVSLSLTWKAGRQIFLTKNVSQNHEIN